MQEKEALISIYNDQGKVIYAKPRHLIDKQNDILKVSYVLLTNNKQHFFMIKPNDTLWPGLWASSCAGIVRVDETPYEAAIRTVKRELGLSPELKPVHETFRDFNGIKRFMYVFYGSTSLHPKPSSTDSVESRWFSAEEIDRILKEGKLSPTAAVVWNMIKQL